MELSILHSSKQFDSFYDSSFLYTTYLKSTYPIFIYYCYLVLAPFPISRTTYQLPISIYYLLGSLVPHSYILLNLSSHSLFQCNTHLKLIFLFSYTTYLKPTSPNFIYYLLESQTHTILHTTLPKIQSPISL